MKHEKSTRKIVLKREHLRVYPKLKELNEVFSEACRICGEELPTVNADFLLRISEFVISRRLGQIRKEAPDSSCITHPGVSVEIVSPYSKKTLEYLAEIWLAKEWGKGNLVVTNRTGNQVIYLPTKGIEE